MLKKISSIFFAILLITCPFLLTSCKKNKNPGNGDGGGTVTPPAEVSSIEIEGTLKDTYFVGDELELTELKVKVTMSDGTTKEITLTSEMVSGFDTTTVGDDKTLTITYEGKTTTASYDVVEPAVTSIALKTELSTKYYIGDSLNLSEQKITATYENGATKDIAISSQMISGFNTTTAGANKTLTITYEGKTTTLTYSVEAVVATKIAVVANTFANNYFVGDSLDSDGKIKVYYNNGTTKEVTITPAMVSNFNTTTAHSSAMTITYAGKTCTHSYTVVAVVATKIEIETNPQKEYYVGDSFVPSSGKIKVTYNNNTTASKAIDSAWVSNFNTQTAGTNKVATITYEGKTATFTYNVTPVLATTLAISESTPLKLTYFQNTPNLETAGVKVNVTYNNGDIEEINLADCSIPQLESFYAGTYELTITYKEASLTIDYTIVEIKPVSVSIQTQPKNVYYIKQPLDVTGGKILLTFNDDHTETKDITANMLTGFSTQRAKTYTINLSYKHTPTSEPVTTPFSYIVKNRSLTLSTPFKLTYYYGEEIDITDGQLSITYDESDGKEPDVIDITSTAIEQGLITITNFNTTTLGERHLYINYDGLQTYAIYTVSSLRTITLKSETDPANKIKLNYVVGDEFDSSKGTLVISYNDGTPSEEISLADAITNEIVTIENFNTETTGQRKCKIAYDNKYIELDYVVEKLQITAHENVSFKTTYELNESFAEGSIRFTYNNGETKEVVITESMIQNYSFDTRTTVENATMQIKYTEENLEYSFTVTYSVVDTSA